MSSLLKWMYKSGTCKSATSKIGRILHLVPDSEGSFTRAVCGSMPNKKGNGWSTISPDGIEICEKCFQYKRYHILMPGLRQASTSKGSES